MSTIGAVLGRAAHRPTSAGIGALMAAGLYPASPRPRLVVDGRLALGASILPIMDGDSPDDQPLALGRLRVVLAGRLDNRDELITELGIGRESSDVSIAARAYRSWGVACPERLIGAFALIVWDPERERLFCATDHMADRPLYYAELPEAFVVASTVRQLCGYGHGGELDEAYLLARLCLPITGQLHSVHTPYQRIKRLLPGAAPAVEAGRQVRTWRYWRPEELPEQKGTVAEFGERLREQLTIAVRAQSRSRMKVMSTLSGGLDSSSITGLVAAMAQESTLPCHGFEAVSVIFDGIADADEREFREAAERHYGIEALPVDGRECWDFRDIGPGGVAPVSDEPAMCYGAYGDARRLAMVTEKAGCNVVLFGDGGDELLSGNDYFVADLLGRGRLAAAWRHLQKLARRPNRTHLSTMATYALRPMWASLRSAPPSLRWEGAIDHDSHQHHRVVPPWVAAGKQQRELINDIYREMATFGMRPHARSREIEAMRCGAVNAVLNDGVFLPLGIEMRSPFYDRRVAELALSVPGELKSEMSGGRRWTKRVLRMAMRDVLPPDIGARRSKANLLVQSVDGLSREWDKIWNGGHFEIVDRGFVDGYSWTQALRAARMGRCDHPAHLAAAVVVELWLRSLVEATRPLSGSDVVADHNAVTTESSSGEGR